MRLAAFLLSCLLAFTAGHIINYSIIFLSLEWFNSHALAGIGYGLCFGPPIILGWFAGVYCDRYSPRHILLIAQNSYFVSLLLLYFAISSSPEIQKTLLLTAALFSGIGWSFVSPARYATLPFYLKPKNLPAGSIALNLMVMMGFGLAPMLLKQIEVNYDLPTLLVVTAVMFIFSNLLLVPLKFDFKGGAKNNVYTEIETSLRIVNNTVHVKHLLILATVAYLLMGPMQVILPTIASDNLSLSDTNQGNYLSLVAFSLIIGGLFAIWSKNQGKLGLQLIATIIIASLGIGYLGQENQLFWSVAILIISASGGGIAISIIVAGLQFYSPQQHRGRIMSFYTIISQVIPAASGIAAGVLAQVFSPSNALAIFATIILLAMLICTITLKDVRELEHL